ncbi:response regulator [Patulibacter brassicae]|uniref:Response regulator n=1 Tax=Patulibacter brassicae TaxID=1705717 RepID=A0ABU4VIV1_9ACTN|nr:response regulator [Patulibacter brassicae]MDX8151069.1 response regulator [Patulibacter brassicae]
MPGTAVTSSGIARGTVPSLRATGAVTPERVRVLVVDDDPLAARMITRVLGARGFACDVLHDGREASSVVAAQRPDVVLLDLHMTPIDGFEVLARLQADHRTALTPVIAVTGDRQPETVLALLTAGADDYVGKPFEVDELQARILTATRRRILLGGVSPLTGLPGNVLLTRAVEQRLEAGVAFGFLHADIDHFKPFNDRYGYVRGDEVIRGLAAVLDQAADAVDATDTVIGHIGGDDFAVVAPVDVVVPLAHDAVARFDAMVPGFHDPEDAARGTIVTRDRQGNEVVDGLLSVSIGVARWSADHPRAVKAVADVAAELKHVAKRTAGSQVAVDRRAR